MGSMVVHTLLLALLAQPSPLQIPASGTVAGSIYDEENGQPLAAAIVTIVETGVEARTGRDGVFRMELCAGSYSLQVRRKGYLSYRSYDISVRPNHNSALTIRLVKADDALLWKRAQATTERKTPVSRAPARSWHPNATLAPMQRALHRNVRVARG